MRSVAHRPPGRASLEYRLSWGVAAADADRAYRHGDDGSGVTVAMIDTGVAGATGLFATLSPASTDLVQRRAPLQGNARHGEETASLLAAAADGKGTFGIAYGATLLSIRADRDGSCARVCSFNPAVLVRAVDYAVDHGARVIRMPFTSRSPIPAIEPALERAVAAGALLVTSAGNDGAADPAWPGRYASDARFAALLIVAGATTPTGADIGT